ncbi:sulfotransferase domain-containing protein [Rhodocaloribacter litoris]|uniref:sulfotransferase domain-containing protein n=1 Tax=Rhodocaloribacter litoris TaxID=2558931 RepID=UPI0014204C7B|nr:sulfotransferase domain-containing protein [Rhodocaloribacter litoris]QXD14290.1 sulfotransferase domain-containing protein [Rhodocaloribacter litoris]
MTLPNFVIAGAAKCGTTSLYHYLKQHPDIYMSPVKEPHFFTFEEGVPDFHGPGDEWLARTAVTDPNAYRALFEAASHEQARGEASPLYLYDEHTAAHIQRYVPEMKIIVLLRNPVDRAYSHFWFMVAGRREPLHDFAAALAEEENRRQAGWEWFWRYTDLGFYHKQLRRYYEVFPAHQIRVYRYEELASRPRALLRSVFEFLEVDPAFVPASLPRYNVSGLPRHVLLHRLVTGDHMLRRTFRRLLPLNLKRQFLIRFKSYNLRKPPMDPDLRVRLVRLYREDILRLQDLLRQDFSDWLRV